jgi:hypothetical protein
MRFVRVVVAAVLTGAAAGSAPVQAADGVPEGWERTDYISYLMLVDLLPEALRWDKRVTVICVANEFVRPNDASEKLVQALRVKLLHIYPRILLLPKGQCLSTDDRDYTRQETVGSILYVYTEYDEEVHRLLPFCAGYRAYWSNGGWDGNGADYEVQQHQASIAVQRTSCRTVGIIRPAW